MKKPLTAFWSALTSEQKIYIEGMKARHNLEIRRLVGQNKALQHELTAFRKRITISERGVFLEQQLFSDVDKKYVWASLRDLANTSSKDSKPINSKLSRLIKLTADIMRLPMKDLEAKNTVWIIDEAGKPTRDPERNDDGTIKYHKNKIQEIKELISELDKELS